MIEALFDRDHFPITAHTSYLNSAGIGLVPLPVQRKVQDFVAAVGSEGSSRFFIDSEEIFDRPRRAAARLFAAAPADIAIVNSAAEAFSQLAAWRRPRRGENIVLVDIDHPSPTLPWLRWAADDGCEIRWVRVADRPTDLSLERIADHVDKDTAVISVSHVQWTTGTCLSLEGLAVLARSVGALLAVDATHSAGVLPIDAPKSGVDMIVTGSFKWVCGYSGTGACYLRPDLAEAIRPVMLGSRTSHGDKPPAGGPVAPLVFPAGAAKLEYGSSAHILRIALANAIDYILTPGLDALAAHTRALGDLLIDGAARVGWDSLSPRNSLDRAGIVTIRSPLFDADRVVAHLARAGVIAMARLGGVRFAPHGFNNEHDVVRAIAALHDMAGG